jgi:hypothetical protein
MEIQNRAPASPQWVGSGERRGLDPLGMQSAGIELYQSLVPGLGNVTLRMRYYGLYAWLAFTYAQKVTSDDPEVWRHFLRRGEALYALIAVAANDSDGVAGSDWAKRELSAPGNGSIALHTDSAPSAPHLKQSFGAFGAAYGSPLYDLNILFENPKHRIPVASPELGQRLARAFADAAGDAIHPFFEAIMSRAVKAATLKSMAQLAPSRIGADSSERQCYQEIMFEVKDSVRHAARRDTLHLILEVAEQSASRPYAPIFRWAMYTGSLPGGKPLSLGSEELRKRRELWWLYHANDLTHVCLEGLLAYLLDLLEGEFSGGASMETLVYRAVASILEGCSTDEDTWRSFSERTLSTIDGVAEDGTVAEQSLTETLLAGLRAKGASAANYAIDALRLLAFLQFRATDHSEVVNERFGNFKPEVTRTLLSELAFLERHADERLHETLSSLLRERVLRRHLWIAVQKLRYQNAYTFLFDLDNGRLTLRKKDGPVLTNPRISPAITFLRDIHLLSDHGITPLGLALVRNAA